MTPKPNSMTVDDGNLKMFSRRYPENDGDEIVVAGMSGHFPNSKNLTEYEYNLFNKVCVICKC